MLAAGIPAHWLDDGFEVAVTDMPTYYGPLAFRFRRDGSNTLRLFIAGGLAVPPATIVVKPPLPPPLAEVEIDGRKTDAFDADSVTCR